MDLGLLLKDVQTGAPEPSLQKGVGEGLLVDDGPPGGVDQNRTGLHQTDAATVEEVPALRSQGEVEGEKIRQGKELLQGEEGGVEEGFVGPRQGLRSCVENLQAEGETPSGEGLPDPSHPHDADGFSEELLSEEEVGSPPLEPSLPEEPLGFWYPSGDGQEKGEG